MSARVAIQPFAGDPACHEAVIRGGYEEPCERPAVGYRLDPREGSPYPVCRKHHRPPYWLTARAERDAAYAARWDADAAAIKGGGGL